MDINDKIQLGEFESINSVNQDNALKLYLEYSNKNITENNINNILNVTNQFDVERQSTEKYRIHGQMQLLSILNNIPRDYQFIEDFFTRPDPLNPVARRNILDQFNFYLVKPIPPSGYTLSNGQESTGYKRLGNTSRYLRKFEIIRLNNDFNFSKAGFAKNIFGEQQYAFSIYGDIDIANDIDGLGFPITELFIYAEYDPKTNGAGDDETVEVKKIDQFGENNGFKTPVTTFPIYFQGSVIDGDVIQFNEANYSQRVFNEMTYKVNIPYENNNQSFTAAFNYKPFIPIRLRYFSNDLQRVSFDSTDYEKKNSIPSYAFNLGNDNYVWRNLVDKGFLDPLTGEGVNYPFINQRHYIFLNEIITFESNRIINNSLLGNTVFSNNTLIQNNISSDLNNIGEKC